MAAPSELTAHVRRHSLIVCVGPGGVGKTTVAASLGVAGAALGLKTLVLTVDPARRLANALGIAALDNDERRIADDELRRVGIEPRGALHAMMLDMKRTWDDLIVRIAPSPEAGARITRNRIYQTLSTALAGSHEYMAAEKLYEVYHERDYDLIVLDTPPTQNALDFLDAPRRIAEAMDGQSLGWLLKPYLAAGRVGLKFVGRGTGRFLKIIGNIVGTELLTDLADFMASLEGTYDGFKERATRVKALMGSSRCTFLVVTATGAVQVDEAIAFCRQLREHDMPVGGFVVNRVRERPAGWDPAAMADAGEGAEADPAMPAAVAERLPPDVREAAAALWPRLDDHLRRTLDGAARDEAAVARLARETAPGEVCLRVPWFDEEIVSIEGLAHVVAHLFPGVVREAAA